MTCFSLSPSLLCRYRDWRELACRDGNGKWTLARTWSGQLDHRGLDGKRGLDDILLVPWRETPRVVWSMWERENITVGSASEIALGFISIDLTLSWICGNFCCWVQRHSFKIMLDWVYHELVSLGKKCCSILKYRFKILLGQLELESFSMRKFPWASKPASGIVDGWLLLRLVITWSVLSRTSLGCGISCPAEQVVVW